MAEKTMLEALAIHGGPKAKTAPNITMYPGDLENGEEEEDRQPLQQRPHFVRDSRVHRQENAGEREKGE